MGEPRRFAAKAGGPFNRVGLAAAHVVADPLADIDPWLDAAIDWERTIAFREHLWDLGLGVAEAMDTAQRGMGLDWNASRALIRRSAPGRWCPPGDRRRWRLYLPPYSPDLNPIEQLFATLNALLRKAAARTRDELWSTIGWLLASVPSGECANYLNTCGYGST